MVIMYVCNFASVEVFTKALAYLLKLLTYLLTYLLASCDG